MIFSKPKDNDIKTEYLRDPLDHLISILTDLSISYDLAENEQSRKQIDIAMTEVNSRIKRQLEYSYVVKVDL